MAEYKLTYFNSRGLAESIRFLFALAEVEFEDERLDKDNWAEVKSNYKWGQLPVLTFANGNQLGQSAAIARFLARKFNFVGENDLDAAHVDEIVDGVKDILAEFGKFYKEEDVERKAELQKNFIETIIPTFLSKLSKVKEENGGDWLVGNSVTFADIFVANVFEIFHKFTEIDILEGFPAVKGVQTAVFNLPKIKEWIEKRPDTQY